MQSKFNSFIESAEGALLAAPTSILLHKLVLSAVGPEILNDNSQNAFILSFWFLMLIHSIAWRYLVRRLNEKYNIDIRPRVVYEYIRRKIDNTYERRN